MTVKGQRQDRPKTIHIHGCNIVTGVANQNSADVADVTFPRSYNAVSIATSQISNFSLYIYFYSLLGSNRITGIVRAKKSPSITRHTTRP